MENSPSKSFDVGLENFGAPFQTILLSGMDGITRQQDADYDISFDKHLVGSAQANGNLCAVTQETSSSFDFTESRHDFNKPSYSSKSPGRAASSGIQTSLTTQSIDSLRVDITPDEKKQLNEIDHYATDNSSRCKCRKSRCLKL